MITVDLPKKLEALLADMASKTNHSESYYIQQAIESFLEDKKDYFVAHQRLEEMEKENDEGVPFEEVVKKYKLDE